MSKVYSIPSNTRVYAVGDIHGYPDALDALHKKIESDIAGDPIDRVQIVYLGDYIDRGPDSKGVIDRLVDRELYAPTIEHVFLLGNHEDAMTSYIDGDADASGMHFDWLKYGGIETLESYGIEPDMGVTQEARVVQISAELEEKMPTSHKEFFKNLKLYHEVGGYLFVHAGIKPGVKLQKQVKQDMTFTREPFMSYEKLHPWRVVHGHTPPKDRQVDIRPNRINVDTGHYMGGPLSALVVEGEDVRVLDVLHQT